MSSQLEKVFFNYILQTKKFFEICKPYFFKNSEIQYVYDVLRDYMLKHSDADIPTPRQIFDMISLKDKEETITKEILKSILQVNLKDYDEKNFIEPKFNAWILSNRLKSGTSDIIDETRNLDNISDFDKAVESANKIKSIVDEMSNTNFIKDDDMGSDFDDPESHTQDTSRYKIKSGFDTIDHMLGGGWDIQTLNVIMAETSNGKCFSGLISVSDDNDIIKNIQIDEFFEKMKNIHKGETMI